MSKEPTSIVGNWLRGFAPLREPQARLVLAAFILMFSWTSFFTMVTGLTDSSSVVSFNVGRGSAALFFALVVRLRRFSRDVRWGAVPYPLAVLTCLTLPLVAVFGQGWPVAALVASFFGGFATIWVSLECFYVLSSLGTRSALVTLMFSLLVSALFRPVIFCAPQGAMCAVVTTFPIASLFLCRRHECFRRQPSVRRTSI